MGDTSAWNEAFACFSAASASVLRPLIGVRTEASKTFGWIRLSGAKFVQFKVAQD
jgi:hypothetical protein